MTNQRDGREVAERFWIERRTQHAFTTKPDPYVETVEVGLVADFNAHYEDLMRAALSREANAALRMRERCVDAVKAALADARRSWPASRATTEYELGARGAFTAALSAIESLTLEEEPPTHA